MNISDLSMLISFLLNQTRGIIKFVFRFFTVQSVEREKQRLIYPMGYVGVIRRYNPNKNCGQANKSHEASIL